VEAALARAERDPRSAAAAGELGMLLHAYDQAESAAACYRRARALDPAAFRWAYLSGVAESRLGRQDEALAALREAVRSEPRSVPARLKLAEALQAAGDLPGSAILYEALIEETPGLPHAHYGLGRVEAARGAVGAAADRFVAATRLFEAYGAAHYALALAYRDLGREEDAKRSLALSQKHLLDAPALDDPLMRQVKELKDDARQRLAEGVRLAKAGDLPAAVREHEKAVEADPTLAQAHANLISLYGRLRSWEKVEAHYQAAVALAPGLADVHYDYAVALNEQGRATEAAEALGRALAINPYHPRAHHNLGVLLLAQGRLEEAAGHFRAVLENEPGYRLAGFNLGRVLVAQGRLREAIEVFQKIVATDDEDTPRYLYALASAYVRAGERDTGVRYAREARDKAAALGQTDLVASIEKDLGQLGQAP
jgi:tetratricopeptide (TPR) repeat protein